MNKIALIRCEHFNAAHRLHNPNWDAVKNKEIFGKCNNENYHGHNYNLEVKIIGYPNPETGFVMNVKLLSDIIKRSVLDKLDHKNLNLDVAEFATLNPTVENIAIVIYDILRKAIDSSYEIRIKLYETARNYVEYPY